MKNKWLRRALSGLLVAFVMTSTVPISALRANGGDGTGQIGTSPLAEFFDESQMSPEYIEWLENGQKGPMPFAQNFSYLAKSYARLRSMQNSSLLPAEYDLRDYGLVEPVVDQGSLGICWAVASNSAAASSLLGQFPQTSFSPIHTSWFTYRGNEEEEYLYVEDPYQVGGNSLQVVATMAAWKGPIYNTKAPLNPDNQANPDENLRHEADYHLQDAYYMSSSMYFDSEWDTTVSNDITKQIVMDTGPVTVLYKADQATYNEETSAWYNSQYNSIDHVVMIVGWDDNYPKENFLEGNQPQNDGAWLIRNSWGTDWGDDGYFWLSYEDKTIFNGNAFSFEENDNYAKNYQYDTMGWSYSMSVNHDPKEATKATGANIFTAEGDEMLEAVSFYTTDAGTKYSISVYTGVEEGKPESGQLMLKEQTGIEPYSGYHTIELDEPVKLNKGERFSIVVDFINPEFAAPLPIEWCLKPENDPDYVPEYMGNGGESYVLCEGIWEDVAGSLHDDIFYITNVCIKGFTNPLPESGEAVSTVRFSEMEGPLADKSKLTLTTEGADEIWYSVDGAEYQKYTGALTLDFSKETRQTMSAYAIENEKQGNTVEKIYTKAVAQLTDLAIKSQNGVQYFETDGFKEQEIFLFQNCDYVRIMAQSGDKITVNGKGLNSADWSNEIPLSSGETTEITVEVQGEGKTSSTYTLQIYRSMLSYNYGAELICFDDDKYSVKDADGNELHNQEKITHLISAEQETKVTATVKETGEILSEFIPKRPAAPIVEAAEITDTSITLKAIDGAMYSVNGNWQESPEFTGLKPDTEYCVQAYLLATEISFYSELSEAFMTTKIPEAIPSDYSFEVKYVDGEGNPVPGGGEIAFDKVGPYSREDIPLPYGYMEVIPAHPDEDWLYPTSLEWKDGQWIVTNPVVEIMVEKMASVEIIFKDTDGNILKELGYTKYYDSEGGGIETVTAPEGYEFVGENTYAVEVSRDADGHLVADPAEVVFVVKAVGTGEPTDPGESTDPENPSTPDNTDPDSPKTGDSSNYLFWSMILLASGGILATLNVCRRKQRKI